jgi:hypothetical protein
VSNALKFVLPDQEITAVDVSVIICNTKALAGAVGSAEMIIPD